MGNRVSTFDVIENLEVMRMFYDQVKESADYIQSQLGRRWMWR